MSVEYYYKMDGMYTSGRFDSATECEDCATSNTSLLPKGSHSFEIIMVDGDNESVVKRFNIDV